MITTTQDHECSNIMLTAVFSIMGAWLGVKMVKLAVIACRGEGPRRTAGGRAKMQRQAACSTFSAVCLQARLQS